jgi:hypothetical protein
VVFHRKVERDARDGLRLDKDQDSREIKASQANQINGVWVGVGGGGVSDVVAVPMLKGEFSDGEGCNGLMLEQEAIVSLIMTLKVDRDLSSQVGAIVDSIFSMIGGGEDSHPSAFGGREQGNALRPTPQIGSLQDDLIGVGLRSVDEGEGQVVIVSKVDVRHVHINIVRPHRLLQVFSIKSGKLRIWGWGPSIGSAISNRQRQAGIRQITIVRGAVIEDKLLWVLLFLSIDLSVRNRTSLDGNRNDKAADRA